MTEKKRIELRDTKHEAAEIFRAARNAFITPMNLRQYDAFTSRSEIIGSLRYTAAKARKLCADYETAKASMMFHHEAYRAAMGAL